MIRSTVTSGGQKRKVDTEKEQKELMDGISQNAAVDVFLSKTAFT